MQLHELRPLSARKKKKRVGRGGKKGTYSGRGGKGQTARAGHRLAPSIRELLKRYPKLKGYRAPGRRRRPAMVTLADLEKNFQAKDVVTPETLEKKGVVKKRRRRLPQVKVVATGKLSKALTLQGVVVSAGARKAVEEQGGNATI